MAWWLGVIRAKGNRVNKMGFTRGDADRAAILALLWWILAAQLWQMGSPLVLGPILAGASSALSGLLREREVNRDSA